ncbi:MAG: hypothetical protein ACT4TC_18830 [Myxococcaceae bacterium]
MAFSIRGTQARTPLSTKFSTGTAAAKSTDTALAVGTRSASYRQELLALKESVLAGAPDVEAKLRAFWVKHGVRDEIVGLWRNARLDEGRTPGMFMSYGEVVGPLLRTGVRAFGQPTSLLINPHKYFDRLNQSLSKGKADESTLSAARAEAAKRGWFGREVDLFADRPALELARLDGTGAVIAGVGDEERGITTLVSLGERRPSQYGQLYAQRDEDLPTSIVLSRSGQILNVDPIQRKLGYDSVIRTLEMLEAIGTPVQGQI